MNINTSSDNLSENPQDIDQFYYTTDTATASWLHSIGFVIHLVLLKSSPYTFIFKKSPELLKSVSDWQRGQAIGNCFLFENSRRQLVKIIKRNGRD